MAEPKDKHIDFQNYKDTDITRLEESFELSCAMECCGKETKKQLRELDNNKLLSLLMNVDIPQSTTLDKIKYQVQ